LALNVLLEVFNSVNLSNKRAFFSVWRGKQIAVLASPISEILDRTVFYFAKDFTRGDNFATVD